eukprot:2534655-Pleurochrysis_carterae.AAC.1
MVTDAHALVDGRAGQMQGGETRADLSGQGRGSRRGGGGTGCTMGILIYLWWWVQNLPYGTYFAR